MQVYFNAGYALFFYIFEHLPQLCGMRPPGHGASPQRALQHLAPLQSAYMGTLSYHYIDTLLYYYMETLLQLDILMKSIGSIWPQNMYHYGAHLLTDTFPRTLLLMFRFP